MRRLQLALCTTVEVCGLRYRGVVVRNKIEINMVITEDGQR